MSLISESELFFTSFEPKLQMRFVLNIDGLPTYLIRKAERPKLTQEAKVLPHINLERYVKGKSKWGPIQLTLYDPIVPSASQAVMEWVRLSHESITGRDGYMQFYQKDVTINVLGPVGDIVEEWILKDAFVTEANFGALDWGNDEPTEISLTLQYNYAILNF